MLVFRSIYFVIIDVGKQVVDGTYVVSEKEHAAKPETLARPTDSHGSRSSSGLVVAVDVNWSGSDLECIEDG